MPFEPWGVSQTENVKLEQEEECRRVEEEVNHG